MDVFRAIQELYEEKKRLDEVIARLEGLIAARKGAAQAMNGSHSEKRRGRKSMSPEERTEVSKRMKEYWAERRKTK